MLCLDADERVSPALHAAIATALARPGMSPIAAPAATPFGRYLRHGEGYPDWSLRLFNRRHARWSDDTVHEKVVVADGTTGTLDGDLLHDSAESLAGYLAKQNRYTSLAAEAAVAAGKRSGALRVALSPLVRFVKFYVLRRGFLDGLPGLVHVGIGCFNSFAKYAKMIEIQQGKQ